MPRPNKPKIVGKIPSCTLFVSCKDDDGEGESSVLGKSSPQICMNCEEYETIRLIDYMGMTQEEAAGRMNVGRATVQALYMGARQKLARFLVEAASLKIGGGNYVVDTRTSDQVLGNGKQEKFQRGELNMTIGVTYENGQVFQHFGHSSQFKIYTVEDGKIKECRVVDTNGSGHGALAGFLKDQGVDVLICGGIGGGARNALAAAGIRLFPGASGDADAQVESFLAGNLNYNPDTVCSHHEHHGEHECHGHGDHQCGGHGGHECGGHDGQGCGH